MTKMTNILAVFSALFLMISCGVQKEQRTIGQSSEVQANKSSDDSIADYFLEAESEEAAEELVREEVKEEKAEEKEEVVEEKKDGEEDKEIAAHMDWKAKRMQIMKERAEKVSGHLMKKFDADGDSMLSADELSAMVMDLKMSKIVAFKRNLKSMVKKIVEEILGQKEANDTQVEQVPDRNAKEGADLKDELKDRKDASVGDLMKKSGECLDKDKDGVVSEEEMSEAKTLEGSKEYFACIQK